MLLLLAGTSEARKLASLLATEGFNTVASLSGATRAPEQMALPTRSGGFGGDQGFVDYLATNKISAVLDATHPFAERISKRTAQICKDMALPHLQLLRPGWKAGSGDRWTMLDREEDAAKYIAKGETVFLATGRQTLDRYRNLSGCRLFCRQIDAPSGDFPYPNGEFLLGSPPFSVEEEVALFKRLNVDWLVVKNAGGQASFSKLEAARQLRLNVAMIKRPMPLECDAVASVTLAMDWVRGLKW